MTDTIAVRPTSLVTFACLSDNPFGGCAGVTLTDSRWSEGGLRLYEERREAGRALLRSAVALDRPRIGLSDGVVVARPEGDQLPSWDAYSEAALDLATMQATLAVHELRGGR